MNASKLVYWGTTGLLGVVLLGAGAANLTHAAPIVDGLTHLGYPTYLATLLGVWKVLGALAIVAPGFPRLKEWAYAGIVFDMSGAAISHLTMGDGPVATTPIVLLALTLVSWASRPADRRLGEILPARAVGSAVVSPRP